MRTKFENFKDLILLVISLILVYFSIDFGFLMLIALVPIFIILKKSSFSKSIIYGALYGLLFILELFYWTLGAKEGLKAVLIATILCSIFFMIFFLSCNILLKRYERYSLFIIPLIFVSLKEIFSLFYFDSIYVNLALVHPFGSAIFGLVKERGVNLLIVLFNLSLINIKRRREIAIFLFIISTVLLNNFYPDNLENSGKEIKFALIQGNFQDSWQWKLNNYEKIYEEYERLTLDASKNNPDFIIWPEYALLRDIFKDKELYEKISKLANKTKSNLIIGTLTFIEENKTNFYGNITDSAVIFGRNGGLIERYDSVLPYPFDFSVSAGKSRELINTDNGSFYIYMCYEEVIPSKFEKTPDFLVSIVNNQHFQGERNLKMVSLHSRIRASENNKYLLRVSNNGITQIINNRGKVVDKLEINKEGILFYNLSL